MNTNTYTATPPAIFARGARPLVIGNASVDEHPEMHPAADAYGRMIGHLCIETGDGAGETRPTHAPLRVQLDAELDPSGIFRTADGKLYALFGISSLAGEKVSIDALVHFEIDPAAPVGAVWDSLFRPAFPADAGGEG